MSEEKHQEQKNDKKKDHSTRPNVPPDPQKTPGPHEPPRPPHHRPVG